MTISHTGEFSNQRDQTEQKAFLDIFQNRLEEINASVDSPRLVLAAFPGNYHSQSCTLACLVQHVHYLHSTTAKKKKKANERSNKTIELGIKTVAAFFELVKCETFQF